MTHSPEPWKDEIAPFGEVLYDAEGNLICRLDGLQMPNLRNAERIVACVNACQGLSNEILQTVAEGKAILSPFLCDRNPLIAPQKESP